MLVAGCSALPEKPSRPVLYDFGAGPMAPSAPSAGADLPPLALGDVEPAGAADTAFVLYRLQYADAQQLRPYSLARWTLPPAQLVRQRIREQLGQRRAMLNVDDSVSQQRVGGALPRILRLQLEEFSQIFSSPADSVGLVRLRATLVDNTPVGERLVAQRQFILQRPASSADALGGVQALTAATDAAAAEISAWLEQAGR